MYEARETELVLFQEELLEFQEEKYRSCGHIALLLKDTLEKQDAEHGLPSRAPFARVAS